MQSLTVLIRMTGLLLLTPQNSDGTGTMHVVMPKTGASVGTPIHFAQLGYDPTLFGPACPHQLEDGLCYLDVGSSMVNIGARASGPGTTLPQPGIADITEATGANVPRSRFEKKDTKVFALINLYSATITDTCAIAEWEYGPPQHRRRQNLSNVVDWKIQNLPGTDLPLYRNNMPGEAVDSVPLVTLRPAQGTRTIELYLRHSSKPAASGRHFHVLHDLAGAGGTNLPDTPVPIILNGEPRQCDWVVPHGSVWLELHRAISTRDGSEMPLLKLRDDPTTQSCIVGSGLPVH